MKVKDRIAEIKQRLIIVREKKSAYSNPCWTNRDLSNVHKLIKLLRSERKALEKAVKLLTVAKGECPPPLSDDRLDCPTNVELSCTKCWLNHLRGQQ